VGHIGDRTGGFPARAVPGAAPAGNGDRAGAAVGVGRPRPVRRAGGDRGRLPRHRVRGGGGAGRRPGLRLHLVRHLVAGGHGTGLPRAHRSGLHQRGGRGRDGPLPAQRDGPVAASGVAAGVAGRVPGRAACGGGRIAGLAFRRRPGRPGVPAGRNCSHPGWAVLRYAQPDHRLAAVTRLGGAGQPGRRRPVRARQPRAGLPARGRVGPGAQRATGQRRARGRRRVPQRTAVPAHRRRLPPPGDRRAGRGHGAGQHAGAGPGARRRARRPGRPARTGPLDGATAPVPAVR
jgi:hypothetical protein